MSTNESVPVYGSVNIDEIVEIGATVPVGRYTVRTLSCDGKLSSSSKPMLAVQWEVLNNAEYEGMEVPTWYSLTVTLKNGKQYASGLQELKKIYAAVGKPLPKGYSFQLGDPSVPQSIEKSLAVNRKMFMEKVGRSAMEMVISRDPKPMLDKVTKEVVTDEEGNPRHGFRRVIVGPANRSGGSAEFASVEVPSNGETSSASAGSSSDELAKLLAS